MGLLLRAVDVDGQVRWRWLLTDEDTGALLAEHHVFLDGDSAELERFRDLYAYVARYAAPDRRAADSARIGEEAVTWAGQELLGWPLVQAVYAAAASGPVTVRVSLPAVLDEVALWPLELAGADGVPMAARGDVCFVYDIAADAPAARKAAPHKRLRILAVFSQSTQVSALALRRERVQLSRRIRQLAALEQAAVELQVVQYGATRERLAEIAADGDGWDVLHLSGHGTVGTFLLEAADGSPDRVPAAELVALLRPASQRVKLAVVSSCESAADATARTYRLLGLTTQAEALEVAEAETRQERARGTEAREVVAAPDPTPIPGLARTLVRELGCAVVAMRYPVQDEFAIAFIDAFYRNLISRRQPVDIATARAAATAAGESVRSTGRLIVALVTPAVFGAQAIGLFLDAPRGRPVPDPVESRMAFFPSEPQRFVGRVGPMTSASAALSPASGPTGVLLYGMAGGGKTACALELAYRHVDSFAAAAYWQAPLRDDEVPGALADFATSLEAQLGGYGFGLIDHIATTDRLQAYLPRLSQLLESAGILLVLDDLDTLLTIGGAWRDRRWELLVSALTRHGGASRVIMSSRMVPERLARGVLRLPVHALSLDEAVGLARELPNLRALLHADSSLGFDVPAPNAADTARDRDQVRRVLRVVRGHPKLMELADASADGQFQYQLALELAAADEAADGERLAAFFRGSTIAPSALQFLDTLRGWVSTVLLGLPAATQLMARFLACLEDGDRQSGIVTDNWTDLWRLLDEAAGPPSPPGQAFGALAGAGLIQVEALAQAGDPGAQRLALLMHPAVAGAVRATAENRIGEAVDSALGAYWQLIVARASGGPDGEDSAQLVQAALAAVPYLLRRHEWPALGALLERVMNRDHSTATAQLVLPALRRAAEATGAPRDRAVLARALAAADPAEAASLQRSVLDTALADGDFLVATSAAGSLITLLSRTGRLAEALDLTPRLEDCARQAGLGPWSQAACRTTRLQVFSLMGEHSRVLAEGDALRGELAALPQAMADETVQPWNVQEAILDTTRNSAVAVADWLLALDLGAELTASLRRRGAAVHELAMSMLTDTEPLIRTGRFAQADRLLADCQRVFEADADTAALASVLSSRASLEAALARPDAALDLERAALRYAYARPEPVGIAVSHHNLAGYLLSTGAEEGAVLCHRLAAAFIFRLTGATSGLPNAVRAAAQSLRAQSPRGQFFPVASRPALRPTLAQVIEVAERTEGVRLAELLGVLCPDPAVAQSTFADLLATVAEPTLIEPPSDEWQALPMRPLAFADLVVAAARGDRLARDSLGGVLPALLAAPGTAMVADWVRRVLAAGPLAGQQAAAHSNSQDADLMDYIAARLTSELGCGVLFGQPEFAQPRLQPRDVRVLRQVVLQLAQQRGPRM